MKIRIEYNAEIFQNRDAGAISIRIEKTKNGEQLIRNYIFPDYTNETIIDAVMRDLGKELNNKLANK